MIAQSPQQQRGAALIIFLLLLVTATATLLINKLNVTSSSLDRDEVTMKALQKAKAALLGYAASYPENNRTTDINAGPGLMTCSDRSAVDGVGYGSPTTPCGPYAIGRLPWEFIGLDDIRDSAGEPLWYVTANKFRNNGNKYFPINSETDSDLIVDGQNDIVAVIIAPGFSLPNQERPSTNPSDYLEGENNDGDAEFITGVSDLNFNDKLIAITRQELMQAVEKRVAGEVARSIKRYSALYGETGSHFPYLTAFRDPRLTGNNADHNLQLISGTVSSGGNTSLSDTGKDFTSTEVSVGDLVHVFNTSAKSKKYRITGLTSTTLSLEEIGTGLSVEAISAGDTYTIQRFDPALGQTLGHLAIQSDQEAFYSPADLSWTNLNGVTTECSQLDATATPTNEASAHILSLRAALQDLSGISLPRENNVCVWTNENRVNCTGFNDSLIVGVATAPAITVNVCDATGSTRLASEIDTRVISYKLQFNADATRIKTNSVDGAGLLGEKIRVVSKTFPESDTGLMTEIVITDFAGADVVGQIRILNPTSGTLNFEHRQIAMSPMSGFATSDSDSTLIDTQKDFIARGVSVGDWIEKVERTDDIENSDVGDLRGIITAVDTSTITFSSKGTGENVLSFAEGDEYRIYNEFPKWLSYNNWHHLTFLAYSPEKLPGGSGACASGSCLSIGANDAVGSVVSGNNVQEALVITSGDVVGAQDRALNVTLSDYLERGNDVTVSADTIYDRGDFDQDAALFNDQVKRIAPCTTGNEIHECY